MMIWTDCFLRAASASFGHVVDGAQELVGEVGENGGAAWRDFVLGEQQQKAGQKVMQFRDLNLSRLAVNSVTVASIWRAFA
jgi:hypothetical protein